MQDMLRSVGIARSSHEALTSFIARYGHHRPIHHFIGTVPEPSVEGGYRVMYDVATRDVVDGTASHTRDLSADYLASLPIQRGGLLGQLMADPSPKLVHELDLSQEQGLSENARTMRSCMAIPIFHGDKLQEWTFGFTTRDGPFDPREVLQGMLVANMMAIANRRIDAIGKVSLLLDAMRDQIDQIARLQQALLPNRIPDLPGIEIATSYLASEEAGGDYYDFFILPKGRLGILMADVSGHGAAAATIMAMLHAILHCYEPSKPQAPFDPEEVFAFANRRLMATGLDGQFVTAFFGILEPDTGLFTYCNAGHPPPRLKSGIDGSVSELHGAAGLPLGVMDDFQPGTRIVQLRPMDTIVLYTDGITESFNKARVMFGIQRLNAALEKCSGQPDSVVEWIHKAVFAHRGSSTRDDDQTLVAVRYHGICVLPGHETPLASMVEL